MHRLSVWLVWPVAGLVLMLAGCAGNGPAEEVARPALVVQAGTGGAEVTAFAGDVRAHYEPVLAFRIAGKLSQRRVDIGARVKAGEVLAELDPADVALQRDAAQAQQASAQADHALAEAELARYRSLFERQLISRSLFETREAAFRAAEARLRQATAQMTASANQAGYAQLRAPKAGVIVQRLAEAGQVVAAGQPVFVLAVDGAREIAISIPEHRIAAFVPGRELAVELWAAPGKRIAGQLREVSPAADPLSRTYAARVSLVGDVSVELGQSARVYAQDAGAAGLALPLSALHVKDGKPAVWVVDPDSSQVSLVPVQVGAYSETHVPVIAGITASDWVVAAGVHLLHAGQRIKPIDSRNRAVVITPAAAPPAPRNATY